MVLGLSEATRVMQCAHMHDFQLQDIFPWGMQPVIAELDLLV